MKPVVGAVVGATFTGLGVLCGLRTPFTKEEKDSNG